MIRIRRQKRSEGIDRATDDAAKLADKHRAIASQIRDLEDYITTAPSRDAAEELDRLETIPPPEHYESRERHIHPVTTVAVEGPRLSRAQQAALLAERRKNMMVFFASAILLGLFVHWLANTL